LCSRRRVFSAGVLWAVAQLCGATAAGQIPNFSDPAQVTQGGTWSNITRYSLASGHTPGGITTGPDDALWFTDPGLNNIGRMTTAGVVSAYYPLPTPNSRPEAIVKGPDDALWFTEIAGNNIGRITTAGVITEYPVPTPVSYPAGITAGPDGALWFTEASQRVNKIGRITTAGLITEYQVPSINGETPEPYGITAGPDGALWFADQYSGKIGRITTAGAVTQYGENNGALEIAAGPDGALWFTENVYGPPFIEFGGIGRITTDGVETIFATSTGLAYGITAGPDGAMWFTTSGSFYSSGQSSQAPAGLVRITTDGVITPFPAASAGGTLGMITVGPDGNLWSTAYGIIQRAPVCGLGLSASSTPGTVSMNFNLGTPTPATWGIWLYQTTGAKEVFSQALSAVVPPRAFTLTEPIPAGTGQLGVGSTLATAAGEYLCAEWGVVTPQ
jgi:virginiamycin B lyase